jgi:hypothetical protein
MGIDVAVVNEAQETKQQVFDPQHCLTSLANDQWAKDKESVCLRFIDAFGETVFNQLQAPFLLNELEHSAAKQINADVKAHLQKVCRLVSAAQHKGHTYIKFTGD